MKLLGIGSRINHAEHGKGVITNVTSQNYWVTFIDKGLETLAIDEPFEIIQHLEQEVDNISFYEIEKSLKNILHQWTDISPAVSIADKWKGGRLVIQPQNNDLQAKEIPIDVFFHKIVMVRDRLRVMEQKINTSSLEESEKIELQQYITRIYGSLTTFNVLFKLKEDQFVGEKSNK